MVHVHCTTISDAKSEIIESGNNNVAACAMLKSKHIN